MTQASKPKEMGLYSGQGQRLYLTQDERQRFLAAARTFPLQDQLLFETLLWSGCRLSEALSLKGSSFDEVQGFVVIESLKKRRREVFRAVPVPPRVFDLARRTAQETSQDRLIPLHRATAHRHVKRAMKLAGIAGDQATAKGLRHGFGVAAVQAGVPLTLVQKWLGHVSISTTAIYTNAIGPEERLIAEKMWALV